MADKNQVVGSVSVKIRPDGRDFRKDAKVTLERQSKGLKVQVPLLIDADNLRQSVEHAVATVNRQAQSNARMHVKVPVRLDAKELGRDLREMVRRLEREAGSVEVDFDTRRAENSIDRLARRADDSLSGERYDPLGDRIERQTTDLVKASRQLDDAVDVFSRSRVTNPAGALFNDADAWTDKLGSIDGVARKATWSMDDLVDSMREFADAGHSVSEYTKIDVSMAVDVEDESKRKIREFVENAKDLVEGADPVFELHPGMDSTSYRWVAARLSILTRDRIVSIIPKVQSAALAKARTALAALSGLRLVTSTLDNLKDLVKNLDKSIPLIGSMAEAVMGLSAWLLAAASNTFALSRSLAQIAGAGLALPGIVAGVAFGVGAMVAVLKDFEQVLPGVGREFSALQDQMSSSFWARAKQPMQDMIDHLFPEFAQGMKQTSAELGEFFAQLSLSMSNHLGGKMQPMFDNLAESIAIGATGTEAWARIIENLGTTGSEYLPRMSQWIVNISQDFDNWLETAANDGRLTGWIDLGIERLKEFGSAINGLGRIFAGLARAAEAAGGSTTAMLADSLQRTADVVNSDAFQSGLTGVLTEAHRMMTMIANGSGASFKQLFVDLEAQVVRLFPLVGQTLGSLFDGLARALNTDGLKDGVVDLFDGLRAGVAALEPMWEPLGNGVGALLSVLGQIAENAGPLLASVLTQISDLMVQIGPDIADVAKSLASITSGMLDTFGPVITGIIDLLASLLGVLADTELGVLSLSVAFGAFKLGGFAKTLGSAIGAGANVGSALASVGSALGTIGRAAGPVGLTAAAIAGLGSALAHVGTQVPEIGGVTDQMTLLGEAVEQGSAPAVAALQQQLEGMFAGDQGFKGWLSGADAIKTFGDAVQTTAFLAGDLGPSYAPLARFLTNTSGEGRQAANAMAAFDETIAQMVNSGNAAGLAAAEYMLADAMDQTGLARDQIVAYLPEYEAAMERQALASQVAAEAEIEAGQARMDAMARSAITLQEQEAVAESLGGVTQSMVGSINEASTAIISFADAAATPQTSLQDFVSNLQKQIEEQDKFAASLASLAENGASQAVVDQLASMGSQGAGYAAQLAEGLEQGSADAEAALETIESAVKRANEGALAGEGTDFTKFATKVDEAFAEVPTRVEQRLSEINEPIDRVFTDALKSAETGAKNIASGASNALEPMAGEFKSHASDSVTGLANGLYGGVGPARAAGAALGRAATEGYRAAMDIRSPSKVMIGMGRWTVEGLVKGLEDNVKSVKAAAKNMATVIREAFTAEGGGLSSSVVNKFIEQLIVAFDTNYLDKIDSALKSTQDKIDGIAHRKDSQKIQSLQKKSLAYEKEIAKNNLRIAKLGDSKAAEAEKKRLRKRNELLQAEKRLNDIALREAEKKQREAREAEKKRLEDKKKALKAEADAVKKHNDKIKKAVQDLVDKYNEEYDALSETYDDLSHQLSDAVSQLEDAKQAWINYSEGIRTSIRSAGDWTKLWGDLGQKGSKAQTVGNLQAALDSVLEKSRAFAADIQNLASRGVDQSLIDSMVNAGLGDAESLAKALANATDEELAALMGSWGQLDDVGISLGDNLADQFYQAGIDAAQGLVDGLMAQMETVAKAMGALGEALIAEIKKVLDIHSPSRVMAKMGKHTGQGFVNGLLTMVGAARDAATALVSPPSASGGFAGARSARAASPVEGGAAGMTLNYYAAPGSSLGAEEDLFDASRRARFYGWRR